MLMQERYVNVVSGNTLQAAGSGSGCDVLGSAGSLGPRRIVGVQGDTTLRVQALLGSLAHQWQARGLRIAGIVEEHSGEERSGDGCKSATGTVLRNLASGARYRLYQDLGPLSTACCLDPGSVSEACQAILDDIAASDLVVLSKFGKLEAERNGLMDAFIAAVEHDRPVLTAVSPAFSERYLEFVGPWGSLAPPEEELLHAWSQHVIGSAGMI
jgi:hypothetical protein